MDNTKLSLSPGVRRSLSRSKGDQDSVSIWAGQPISIMFMILLHAVLALAMREVGILSTLHALVVLSLGLWKALSSKELREVLPLSAYVVGSEVLWRMTKADIFWEYAKYALVLILIVALIKQRKVVKAFLPILFFSLLLPSIFLTIDRLGFSETTREAISFNLSGPLSLAVCALVFMNTKLTDIDIRKMIWSIVYPVTGILTLAAVSTFTAEEINFVTESNFVTSGGYGPNQVSAILALASLLVLMLVFIKRQKGFGLIPLLLSLALITQSILTFSRGGIVNIGVTLVIVILQLLLRPEKSTKQLFLLLLIIIFIAIFVIPRIEIFTAGALSDRYSELSTTGRTEILEADLDLFTRNPITGVGPGISPYLRLYGQGAAAHTEYSRLLAEHGVLGLGALLILFFLFIRSWWKAPGALSKAWVLALGSWALIAMANIAMRNASIGFMFGWALAELHLDSNLRKHTLKKSKF